MKPWYREQDGYFYTTSQRWLPIHGKTTVKLSQDLVMAEKLLSNMEQQLDPYTIGELAANNTNRFVKNLVQHFGHMPIKDFVKQSRQMITRWLNKNKSWKSPNTKRFAIQAVNRLFEKPLDVDLPQATPRETYFTQQQINAIYAALKTPRFHDNGEFAEFFTACLETGGRTFVECANFTTWNLHYRDGKPAFFDLGKVKGKTRYVYLSHNMQQMVSNAIKRVGDGALFLNSKGTPWTSQGAGARFRRLRQYLMDTQPELGLTKDHCLYSCRHTFIIQQLTKTKDAPLVAELAGHSIQVMEKHYKKWGARVDVCLNALS